ncbi:PIG-L deacetylase family protein [Amaricoccus solimangrovi]|uniref:PIG-L family deacetylase n=1 Tax=Amaricoccus solimangrovi TaxID=2589815 RepID=A0A501WIA5_9RHOB|nr:PIG-L deacetylase family protein [Amaricoccus solimangrovi]TPE46857.1 PIG-L family deacetylase [Amaricoccus solimangrovi]
MIRPAPLTLPDGPVLVVAPHPDDETLGCGGLIAAAVARGLATHVLFVTDGGASHPGSRAWPRARLARRREAEAEEALRRLGAGGAPRTFLRLPDAGMPPRGSPAHAEALGTVTRLVRDLGPALVLLPWRRDPHRDHRDAWALATEALARAPARPEVLEYAIWLDELGAPEDHPAATEMEPVSLRVSPEVKRGALRAHASQLGLLVEDDPTGFVLGPATIDRLTGPEEIYWRPCER